MLLVSFSLCLAHWAQRLCELLQSLVTCFLSIRPCKLLLKFPLLKLLGELEPWLAEIIKMSDFKMISDDATFSNMADLQ